MKIKFSTFLRKEYLLLYLLILIGVFLRLQGVFTNSFAFTYDVGRDMLALSNIVHIHKIPLIGATTGLPGIFYGPWWYYMLTPFFVIFSGDPQGIALTMSLIGIIVIILSFYFGKKIGGNFLGLTLASLVSVSGVMISLSSQIWNPNIAPFFVVLALLVLSKIFENNKKSKSFLYFFLGICLTLSIDIEIVYGLLLSIGIILSVLLIQKKFNLRSVVFFVLGGLIIIAPRIVFELRHQFLMTKALVAFLTSSSSSSSILALFHNFIDRVNILFNQFASTLANDNKLLAGLEVIFIAFSIVLFYRKSEKIIKNFIKIPLVVILIFLIGITFFSHDIWPHYLVGLPVFYLLLFAISIYLLAKNFSAKLAVLIVLMVFLFNLNPYSQIQNLSKPLWEGDSAVYRNQVAVIDYIYKQAAGKSFKYVVYTPPVYDYTYQYLFDWYGPKAYHYSPQVQANLAYFILEPDYQDPSRLRNWLIQREADGRIIRSQQVRGGIIVQTRIH
jgi:4-amino-4-deoxy-L-arabinose transferase-like glycosyltransferase